MVLRGKYSRVACSLVTSETSSIAPFSFHSPIFYYPSSSTSPSQFLSLNIKYNVDVNHDTQPDLSEQQEYCSSECVSYHAIWGEVLWRTGESSKKAGEIQGSKYEVMHTHTKIQFQFIHKMKLTINFQECDF